VIVFLSLLIPLAVVAIGAGCLLGGRAGQILLWIGTVFGGFAVLWVLTRI
jgi:hypothetical protein